MVRNAAKKTQEALFESGIYNKSPRLWYLKGDSVAEQEYTAWHNFYDGAWKDFRKMDSLLMKLQKSEWTEMPASPDEHNFKIGPVPESRVIPGYPLRMDDHDAVGSHEDNRNKRP